MSSTNQLPTRSDIVVIGSGIIGAATAYNLVASGANVTLVERGDFCGEASGANIGLIPVSSKSLGLLLDLGRRSMEIYATLSETLGRHVHFDQVGAFHVAITPESLEKRRELTRQQQALGMEVYDLTGDEARAMEPMISPKVLGASFSPTDGMIYPFSVVAAYLHRAMELGMTFVPHTEVTGFRVADQRVHAVETNRGTIHTDCVINAGGAWAGHVAEMAGVNVPIVPVRGQVLVTEPLDGHPEWIIAGIDPSIRKTWAANGLIGSCKEYVGFEKQTTLQRLRAYAADLTEMFPHLQDVQVLRSWSGLRPSTPDEKLVLGESDRVEGFITAGGAFRDGMLYGPAMGEVARDIVLGREPEIDISDADPNRFEEQPVPAFAGD